MDIFKEYIDPTALLDSFNLSRLWKFREDLAQARLQAEEIKLEAIREGNMIEATKFGRDLHFIGRNLETIEMVMMEKELDIFMYTEYGDSCLN